MWIPKRSKQNQPRKHKPTRKTKQGLPAKGVLKRHNKVTQKTATQSIWLPKTLLQAQQGSDYKWVPKTLLKSGATAKQQKRESKPQKKKTMPQQQLAKGIVRKRWVSKQVLQHQGYYTGATHVWLPREARLTKCKPQTPIQTATIARPQTLYKKKWVKKVESNEPKTKKVSPTVTTNIKHKATAQEKGKWIPKVAEKNSEEDMCEIPSTSQQGQQVSNSETIKVQGLNKPSTLDAAKHLAFIIKVFNNKKVREHFKRFMAHNSYTLASSANALGPYLLQDPSLAQH